MVKNWKKKMNLHVNLLYCEKVWFEMNLKKKEFWKKDWKGAKWHYSFSVC